MKHLELHILQSFPVACLNRDDLNSPKTAIFGGVQRARVSSQSWKRAIRKLAAEISPRFQGQRTRLIVEPLRDVLIAEGVDEAEALEKAKALAEGLSKFDSKTEKKTGKLRVKTLFFTSKAELETLAKAFLEVKDVKKAIKKAASPEILKDAADIALFGRMVANDHSLTLEGAALFSHALSTHKVDNEIDFFSAVDDWQSIEESGAGMTGTLEFNSATYYRFAALNLDMLADKEHLQVVSREERQEIVRTFIEATLMALPGARKNSMNAATLPGYVLGVVRSSGHPVQLVNAFEKPIRTYGGKGLFETSLEAMTAERDNINAAWRLDKKQVFSGAIPDMRLGEFLDQVCAHVE
ncbi:MAG: type I-E CRISPR-associated protein Cas7/Cse4/CasC [Acidobacteriales bacterium]|nr:type I-E CRISPR-associated protein Cas7/Cse4/CasC [Terriglobales bacterium]